MIWRADRAKHCSRCSPAAADAPSGGRVRRHSLAPRTATRKVTTSVSVFDGSTVVLGGLIREDVQKVEDKVPLLGDVPILGRLFRSSVDQHIKTNLVMFVTARLMNPAGDRVRPDEEQEEVVETLAPPEIQMPKELPLLPK